MDARRVEVLSRATAWPLVPAADMVLEASGVSWPRRDAGSGGTIITGNRIHVNEFGVAVNFVGEMQLQLVRNFITDNHSDGVGVGVSDIPLPGRAVIKRNRVLRNGRDGVHVSGCTSPEIPSACGAPFGAGITFYRNIMLDNGRFDCAQESDAARPTWLANVGRTSSPPGLCDPPS